MAEVGSGVMSNVKLQLYPATVGLPDLFAPHTDWQYPAKICQFPVPRLVQRTLGLDLVCNVDAAPDIALELVLLAIKWRTPVEDPPVLSIMTLEPIFHLKYFLLVKCIAVHSKAVLEIAGMNTVGPSVPVLLFQTAPPELEPAVVEIIALSTRVGTPDHKRGLLHQDLILD
jgi:hypothetical protein